MQHFRKCDVRNPPLQMDALSLETIGRTWPNLVSLDLSPRFASKGALAELHAFIALESIRLKLDGHGQTDHPF